MVPSTSTVASPTDVADRTALLMPMDDLVTSDTMIVLELLSGVPQRHPLRRTISKDAPTCVATVQGESTVTTRTTLVEATPQFDEPVATAGVVVVVVVDALAIGASVANAITIAATTTVE